MSIVVTIISISLLIILHELGHYWVARICGMKVNRFSLGFGPPLFKKVVGETIWQVSVVPFGGYVQIEGMGPTEAELEGKPQQSKALDPHSFRAKPVWQRILVIFAGPAMNWVLAAFLLATLIATTGLESQTRPSTTIGQIQEHSAADTAGLRPGDTILSIDGKQTGDWPTLLATIRALPDRPVEVRYQRDGMEATTQATALVDDTGPKFGIIPKGLLVQQGFPGAVGEATVEVIGLTKAYAGLLAGMFSSKTEGRFSGIPGIVKAISHQAEEGFHSLLRTLAWFSVGLFLLNLVPIPALDGGRLVFLAVETVRGRPIDAKFEGVVHGVGFLILMAAFVFFSIRDLIS